MKQLSLFTQRELDTCYKLSINKFVNHILKLPFLHKDNLFFKEAYLVSELSKIDEFLAVGVCLKRREIYTKKNEKKVKKLGD